MKLSLETVYMCKKLAKQLHKNDDEISQEVADKLEDLTARAWAEQELKKVSVEDAGNNPN